MHLAVFWIVKWSLINCEMTLKDFEWGNGVPYTGLIIHTHFVRCDCLPTTIISFFLVMEGWSAVWNGSPLIASRSSISPWWDKQMHSLPTPPYHHPSPQSFNMDNCWCCWMWQTVCQIVDNSNNGSPLRVMKLTKLKGQVFFGDGVREEGGDGVGGVWCATLSIKSEIKGCHVIKHYDDISGFRTGVGWFSWQPSGGVLCTPFHQCLAMFTLFS